MQMFKRLVFIGGQGAPLHCRVSEGSRLVDHSDCCHDFVNVEMSHYVTHVNAVNEVLLPKGTSAGHDFPKA